ncbi:hypothetical protein KQX54_010488 [Cotesia glomerata]|uniref:Uncharacterized protein n=1 Tax=Cotesia glomerata TaxID=32391 RepID=A0AAV7IGR7_COTGL|nr:hypothetical protein KQX54_010488 [Cotesia glomerata]
MLLIMGNLQSAYIPRVWIATTSHAAVFKIIDYVWNHQINVMGLDLSKNYKLSISGQEAEIRFLANESVWFALTKNDSERKLNEVLYIHLRPSELEFLRNVDSTSDYEVEVIEDSTNNNHYQAEMDELNQNETSSSSYEKGYFYSPDSYSDEEMHQIMHGKTPLPLIEDYHYQAEKDVDYYNITIRNDMYKDNRDETINRLINENIQLTQQLGNQQQMYWGLQEAINNLLLHP